MEPRKNLFNGTAPSGPAASQAVGTLVNWKYDKKAKALGALSPSEKMICALRKVLAKMSAGAANGTRYYIAGDQVRLLGTIEEHPGAKEGEGASYKASGRFQMGLAHAEAAGFKKVVFEISFHDCKDELGLPDVAFDEATTLDELPANAEI